MEWTTKDGTRKVEAIELNGQPVFKVTDPRHSFQSRSVLDFIPVFTRRRGTRTILAAVTVARLRAHGVELTDLNL